MFASGLIPTIPIPLIFAAMSPATCVPWSAGTPSTTGLAQVVLAGEDGAFDAGAGRGLLLNLCTAPAPTNSQCVGSTHPSITATTTLFRYTLRSSTSRARG